MKRTAFSLLELSIVIVIIALLIGGVVAGQSMVKAAEIRSVMTDANKYISAIKAFRDQYRYLPGDMPTATNYWSSSASGDGDGIIGAATAERFRAWEHLSNAGLIDGKFTGATGGGGANDFVMSHTSNTPNIPSARITGTGFAIYYANMSATTTTYAVNLGNLISFGASAGSNNGEPIWAALPPADAFYIDTKADDGKPGTGNWIANLTGPAGAAAAYNFGGASSCSSDPNGSTYAGNYLRTHESISCSFFIMTGY